MNSSLYGISYFLPQSSFKGTLYILLSPPMYVSFNVLSPQVGHQNPMKLDLEVNKLGESIVKGIVHPKMNPLSSESFTYCYVIPNSHNLISSSEKKKV